jgi:hypothetical protein
MAFRRAWRQEIRKVKREQECLARIGYEAVSHNLHRLANPFGNAGDFSSKQALRDDLESRGHHVLMNVARFAAGPGAEKAAGGASHHWRIGQNVFATKGRLDQSSLMPPGFSFVGQQAITEDARKGTIVGGLGEVPGIDDQHVFDVAGMHQQADRNVKVAKFHNVAIVLGASRIKSKPVA